jgi:hypothetical protein
MKQLNLLLFVCCLVFNHINAQRLVPIIHAGTQYPFEPIQSMRDMEVIDDNLIVVGSFDLSFGDGYNCVFSWNGTEMESIPGITEGSVESVTEFNDQIVIAHRIPPSLAVVEKWTGSSWEQIGEDFDDEISDLIVHEGELFAAGEFDDAVKKWNGSNWVGLGVESYDDANCFQSALGKLYVVFDSEIPAFFENGVLNVITSSLDIQYILGSNRKGEDVFFTGSFLQGTDQFGMLKVSGNELILDGTSAMVGPRREALFANNQWYSFSREEVFVGSQKIADTYPHQTSSSTANTKLVEYQGEVYMFNDPFEFTVFYGGETNARRHLYKITQGEILNSMHAEGHQFNVNLEPSGVMLNMAFAQVGLNYPADSLTRPFFGHTLLASATVGDDTLVAGQEYGTRYQGWTFGPVANEMNQSFLDRFMKVWRISRDEINSHSANYSNSNYVIPVDIATWPGNGNTENGESFRLAPFIDVNNNQYYEPQLGDYPDVPGDEVLYMMLNDRFTYHSANYAAGILDSIVPMDLEAHVFYYAFDNQPDPMDKTLFMRATVFNRSENDYTDLRLGLLSDYDIGNPMGDYIGCDSLLNYTFAYNSVNMDNDTVINNLPKYGYGLNPPATASVFLNQEIASNIISTSVNNINFPRLPNNMSYLYEEMHGKDESGDEVVYNNVMHTPVMFSDSPCLVGGENELTSNLQLIDRVLVTSSEDMTLLADDYVCFDIALTVTDQSQDHIGNVCSLAEIVPVVKQFYADQNLNLCDYITNTAEEQKTETRFRVFPIPSDNLITIYFEQKSSGNDDVLIYDLLGNVVLAAQVENAVSSKSFSVGDLSNGVYFLTYQHSTTRIVITR